MAVSSSFLTLLVVLSGCLLLTVEGLITVPAIISSNMVLQRTSDSVTSPVIWGQGTVGKAITFLLENPLYSGCKATVWPNPDVNGGFQTSDCLDQVASTGWTITLSDADGELILENVAFGDVVLCSGQSNMELTVNGAFNASEEIANSINYPDLRMFTLARSISWTPETTLASRSTNFNWTVSGPNAFEGDVWDTFSATCYFQGRDIYQFFNGEVPIGLVASSWGGTCVESWSSPDALERCPSFETEKYSRPVHSSDNPTPPPDSPNYHSVLYNGMIAPILPMSFTYVVWYQGECNAYDPLTYACRFPAMISDWRLKLGQPDLPFFFVQLAAYPDGGTAWPLLQSAQAAALVLPNTGMAVANDIGDVDSPNGSIHPRNKQEVGRRLSLHILDTVYGYDFPATGPIASNYTAFGNSSMQITFYSDSIPNSIYFGPTANCSTCCDEIPFEFVTTNENWYRAMTVEITQPNIVTISYNGSFPDGGTALGVRYAYENFPECVLYNDAHLPASVFEMQCCA